MIVSYNLQGKKVEDVQLNQKVFGINPNTAVIHQVLVAELAGARQGTASTKGRSEVRGGGRKPRRQKGTGMARQGTIRAPQWVGGGVVHGPKPRDFSKKVNKKVIKLALRSALSAKAKDGEIMVLENCEIKSPKTKLIKDFMNKVNLEKGTLFLLGDFFEGSNENFYYSARNVKDSTVIDVFDMCVYWILKYKNIVLTRDAIAKIEEVLL